jgi:hypothetical protein
MVLVFHANFIGAEVFSICIDVSKTSENKFAKRVVLFYYHSKFSVVQSNKWAIWPKSLGYQLTLEMPTPLPYNQSAVDSGASVIDS